MSKQLTLKIVTPERLVLEEQVEQVTIPTTEGEITVLPEHIPLVVGLGDGDVVALVNGEHVPIVVSGGFIEVAKNEKGETIVAVLADYAEHMRELTDEKIAEAKALAEELKKKMDSKDAVNFEHFESELARSLTRIKVADKWRTRKYRK